MITFLFKGTPIYGFSQRMQIWICGFPSQKVINAGFCVFFNATRKSYFMDTLSALLFRCEGNPLECQWWGGVKHAIWKGQHGLNEGKRNRGDPFCPVLFVHMNYCFAEASWRKCYVQQREFTACVKRKSRLPISLLASLYNPIVNPAMVSTVRFYDRNELYGSRDVRNCQMPNVIG